jgi:hypothetical protein
MLLPATTPERVDDGPSQLPRQRRYLNTFGIYFGLFFAAFAVWSWATPLFGVPDEPVHEIKAVAVAHGQFLGTPAGSATDPDIFVTVPALYADAGNVPDCFAFKASVPASCAPAPTGGSQPTSVDIYVGRYPPLYYLVVGLPSLLTTSVAGIYLMRLMSALVCALFLALAAASVVIWSRSRILLAGLALAATPSLFFFGGAINPSGLEASAATCLWCSALVLVLEHIEAPPRGLLVTVVASACVTLFCRGLSPLWVAMIGLAILLLAPRQAALLIRQKSVRIAAAVIVGCALLATVWIVTEHSLDLRPSILQLPKNVSDLGIVEAVLGRWRPFLAEMIGQFGWLDTPSPNYTYFVWIFGVGGATALALVAARRRQLAVLAGVILATIVTPVIISSSQARNYGLSWQGKDLLPFAVGVPLLAAALAGQSEAVRARGGRLVAILVAATATAEIAAFMQALRRNAVGLPGPLNYLNGSWRPPLGALLPTLAAVAVSIALAALFWVDVRSADR